ncbi:MAG: cobalamin B12-binding domain-containing protein [Deltaproteobacteria bacterium]|nr:cobalamin B12-binding domain-containing protein [Deltaproteobacteria bacterium]
MSIEKLKTMILDGDDDEAIVVTEKLLKDNKSPLDVIEQAIRPALNELSEKLACGEMFVPDLILAGEAAKASMNLLKPLLAKAGGGKTVGKILVGVVEGDTHDIGKDLVGAMLTAAGFEVIDLDTNVSPNHFIEAIRKYEPDIVGASAYTSASAMELGRLNDALIDAGLRDRIKLLIGGASVYRDDIPRFGADDFGYDALEAVHAAKRMVGAR